VCCVVCVCVNSNKQDHAQVYNEPDFVAIGVLMADPKLSEECSHKQKDTV